MSRKNKTIQLLTKAFLLSTGLALVACGGGDSGSSYPNISYAGATNEATVTETNAKDFPVAALEGSSSSYEANPFSSLGGSGSSTPTAPSAAIIDGGTTGNAQHTAMLNILAEQIKDTILKQQQSTGIDSNIVSAVTYPPQPGTCSPNPGSLTIDDNSTQTNLNASYTYDNFCVDFSGFEVVQHGRVNVRGSFSSDPLILNSISISIEYMKMTVSNGTETYSEEFSGSMTMTFDETTNNNLTNFTISTNFQANGLTYKIENLIVDNSAGTFSVSGRFYHPLHGYVDITTSDPFNLVSVNPDKYCSGSLQLTGAGGTIDFTANVDCSSYDICYTATGDPTCTTPTTYTWP